MKAILLHEHGGPEKLVYGDCETPAPAAGEVLVRVTATSVNRADTVVRRGYPGLTVPLPHILGGDIAGVIEAVPPGLTGWAQINGRDDLPIPEKVDFDEYYLQNQSLQLDFKILLRTIPKVIRKDGVSH